MERTSYWQSQTQYLLRIQYRKRLQVLDKSKRFRPSSNANTSMEFDSELDSDEEDITADMLELSIQGVEPLTHDKSTQREDSTYLKKTILLSQL